MVSRSLLSNQVDIESIMIDLVNVQTDYDYKRIQFDPSSFSNVVDLDFSLIDTNQTSLYLHPIDFGRSTQLFSLSCHFTSTSPRTHTNTLIDIFKIILNNFKIIEVLSKL